VLSLEEIALLINASGTLYRRTLLMTLYATGMRRAEAFRLNIGHIDSQRMIIRVDRGKGGKSRDDRRSSRRRWDSLTLGLGPRSFCSEIPRISAKESLEGGVGDGDFYLKWF
jgi:integrase